MHIFAAILYVIGSLVMFSYVQQCRNSLYLIRRPIEMLTPYPDWTWKQSAQVVLWPIAIFLTITAQVRLFFLGFTIQDQQRKIFEATRAFVAEELAERIEELEGDEGFDHNYYLDPDFDETQDREYPVVSAAAEVGDDEPIPLVPAKREFDVEAWFGGKAQ